MIERRLTVRSGVDPDVSQIIYLVKKKIWLPINI
jgi:hypothetical protein